MDRIPLEIFNNFEEQLWEQLRKAGYGVPIALQDPMPLPVPGKGIRLFLIAYVHGVGQYRLMWGFAPDTALPCSIEDMLRVFHESLCVLIAKPGHPWSGFRVGATICSDTVAIINQEDSISLGWLRPYRFYGEISVLMIACDRYEMELLEKLHESQAIIEALHREVRERKSAEAALQSANKKIQALYEQSEASTKAKSSFLANMSHELRTPMNGIIGFSELLMRESLQPEQHEYVEIIGKSARDLLTLLNDLLDFSKVEAQKMTLERIHFDPVEVALEAAEVVSPNLRNSRVLLLADFDPALDKVVGDPTRFRQVLINLLGNAVKYTENGYVRIVLRRLSGGGHGVQSLLLRIEDTGVGIDPQFQARLFQAFTQSDATTTRKYGGTGLGLAITKNLVELMGGKITVESEVGKGSVFTVAVPFGESGEPKNLSGRGRVQAPEGFPAYCLLLDARKESRDSLLPALESLGLSVFVADSYDAAFALSQHIAFPLRIVDLPSLKDPMEELADWSREKRSVPLIGIQPTPAWANHDVRTLLSGIVNRPLYPGNLATKLWEAWTDR